ncbi:MAG: ankyrin repeat domain-containing protein [Pyrinomonadaceae bacterium]
MNSKVDSGCKEFLEAIANEDRAAVIALLQDKQNNNCRNEAGVTGLMIAADRGYDEIIKNLLEAGAEIDAKDYGGMTALMTAACSGKASCVKILLEMRSDVRILANDGSSPLMYAVLSGQPEVVKLLLDAGASTDIINNCGMTALKLAIDNRYRNIWQMLKRTPDNDYTKIIKLLEGKTKFDRQQFDY